MDKNHIPLTNRVYKLKMQALREVSWGFLITAAFYMIVLQK